MSVTSLCFAARRAFVLATVRRTSLPFVLTFMEGLFGRPLMEALDITINYASGKVKWGRKAWIESPWVPRRVRLPHGRRHCQAGEEGASKGVAAR